MISSLPLVNMQSFHMKQKHIVLYSSAQTNGLKPPNHSLPSCLELFCQQLWISLAEKCTHAGTIRTYTYESQMHNCIPQQLQWALQTPHGNLKSPQSGVPPLLMKSCPRRPRPSRFSCVRESTAGLRRCAANM